MATLEENINQAISDFDDMKQAIEEQGVEVPYGTDTSQYGNLVRSIPKGGEVDQNYNPESENAQSGIAVAQAMETLPIRLVTSPDENGNHLDAYSLETGTYILSGKFKRYPNDSVTPMTFSSGQLVAVRHGSVSTVLQIFYPPNNAIQYVDIRPNKDESGNVTSYTYTRQDAKLVNMESTANKTQAIDENSTEEKYPSAKAVWDAMPVKYLESLDTENMKIMRDIESGYYVFTGYFKPYPNSKATVIMDTMYVSVARLDEGSHLMAISPLNFKITCYEILVDDTVADGFTYTQTKINLLELQGLVSKVAALETDIGDIDATLDNIITIQNELIGGGSV